MAVTDKTAEPASSAAGAPRRPRRRWLGGRNLAFWYFVGPFLIGLAIFTYIPVGWSAYLSLFDARNTVSPAAEDFVGLDNFVTMLTDENFRRSLITFSIFALFVVPLTFASSLGLALAVNKVRIMRAFFRSVFFLPFACSYVVASLVWKMSIFTGVRYGMMNSVLDWLGIDGIAWLAGNDPPWFWLAIVTLRIWIQCGFYMILFIAALQQIPEQLYEAAYVDGAKPGRQTFWHITMPGLRATSVAVLMLIVIQAYQAFDEFYNLLPNNGNVPYARTPLIYLYNTALGTGQDLGKGSAGALILALLIAIVTLLQGRFLGFGKSEGR